VSAKRLLAGSAAMLLAGGGLAHAGGDYRNLTSGGPLRPGVYGRIVT
jgi:hypothetical protein